MILKSSCIKFWVCYSLYINFSLFTLRCYYLYVISKFFQMHRGWLTTCSVQVHIIRLTNQFYRYFLGRIEIYIYHYTCPRFIFYSWLNCFSLRVYYIYVTNLVRPRNIFFWKIDNTRRCATCREEETNGMEPIWKQQAANKKSENWIYWTLVTDSSWIKKKVRMILFIYIFNLKGK